MNKKNNIIIILILTVIIIIPLIIGRKPENLESILLTNNYKLSDEKNIITDKIVSKYQKGKNIIMIYVYNNLDEIKEEIITEYKQYQNNKAFAVTLKNKNKYIYMQSCDSNLCYFNLGNENKLVQAIVEVNEKKEIEALFKDIMKRRKLI